MTKKEDSIEIDFTKFFSKIKIAYVLLFIFLCLGFYGFTIEIIL